MKSTKEHHISVTRLPRATRLFVVASILLALVYLLQSPSPLRLNTDSIVLLSIGASAADGHGFLYHCKPTHFPSGYPAIVALLTRLRLASSGAFILLNCFSVSLALITCYLFYRNPLSLSPRISIGLCCMVMLSFVLVKHVTLPLSDVVFIGIFMPSLLLLTRARDDRGRMKWSLLGLAFLLTLAAITVRTAGVTLLPAFAWVVGVPLLTSFGKLQNTRPYLLWSSFLSLIILGALCAFSISKTQYFAEMKSIYFQDGLLDRLLKNLVVHTTEMGELGINVPEAKAPALLKPSYPLVGIVVIGLIIRGIWLRRRSFGVLELTLLTYSVLIFAWPYLDSRFWLPALPLIAGFIALTLIDAAKQRCFKFAGIAACVWFSIAGLAAMAYSTRISWAGARFADVYGDGTLRSTYQTAFLGQTCAVEDSDAMLLLKRYDSRTRKTSADNGM